MWHCPPFNPVCLSSPTPRHQCGSSIASPRSFLNPPRYILPPPFFLPTSHCVVNALFRGHLVSISSLHPIPRPLVFAACRLSILSFLPVWNTLLHVLVFFCLAFLLRCMCAMSIVSVFCLSRATSTTISSYLCLSPISCYLPAPYWYFALVLILLSIRCKLACDIHTILHPLVGVPQVLVSSREGRPLP